MGERYTEKVLHKLSIANIFCMFTDSKLIRFLLAVTPCSCGNVHIRGHFTILHITGRLHTYYPPICPSVKNIYRIKFKTFIHELTMNTTYLL